MTSSTPPSRLILLCFWKSLPRLVRSTATIPSPPTPPPTRRPPSPPLPDKNMTTPRMAYREADVRGATAVRLVVLLYDQLIQDLTRAAQAIELNHIELRTNSINHAILVIGYLQSPLDFEKGGKVARDLDHFYNTLR